MEKIFQILLEAGLALWKRISGIGMAMKVDVPDAVRFLR